MALPSLGTTTKRQRICVNTGCRLSKRRRRSLIPSCSWWMRAGLRRYGTPLSAWIHAGISCLSSISSWRTVPSASSRLRRQRGGSGQTMKLEPLKKRLDRNRPKATLSIRFPRTSLTLFQARWGTSHGAPHNLDGRHRPVRSDSYIPCTSMSSGAYSLSLKSCRISVCNARIRSLISAALVSCSGVSTPRTSRATFSPSSMSCSRSFASRCI